MPFQSITGQQHVKRTLQNSLRSGKLAHAYIFSGPSGTGRKQMAVALAQAVYCQKCSDDACGTCVECRRVEHGNHPDLHFIEPEGASIKIDQIRELQKNLAQRPMVSGRQIYIMSNAEKMTIQAANSLLKFLEEPSGPVLAVLITENGHALLPTIQSRAQWLSFLPLAADEIEKKLIMRGYPRELSRAGSHLAAGVEAAEELVKSEWFAETRNLVIQLAKESMTRFSQALALLQQKINQSELNEHLEAVLDLWLLWFQDMVQLSLGNREQLVYADQLDWVVQNGYKQDIRHYVSCMEYVVEARRNLRYHVNPQLALERVIIQIQGG